MPRPRGCAKIHVHPAQFFSEFSGLIACQSKMSILDRFCRLWENFEPACLEERTHFGLQGEQEATEIIRQTAPEGHVANVVVPSLNDAHNRRETDHVVLRGGTIFIVEVKNYKGTIFWASGDRRELVHEKGGRFGEVVPSKLARNPLGQAQSFIVPLKRYLATHSDSRFNRLYMRPVGAFTRHADIRAIHDPDQGLLYIDELPEFFAQHESVSLSGSKQDWMRRGIENLPRLDLIKDYLGQTHFRMVSRLVPGIAFGTRQDREVALAGIAVALH